MRHAVVVLYVFPVFCHWNHLNVGETHSRMTPFFLSLRSLRAKPATSGDLNGLKLCQEEKFQVSSGIHQRI